MDEVECVVVGAGVVGLACARALARAGREVVVLEAEGRIGSHTSSRNSEVIHAGIYYPRGSAKARLCVRGRALLYAYCASRGRAAQAARQDHRRDRGGPDRGARRDRRGRPRQRGRGSRAPRRRRARRARARPARGGGALLALDRHRRQPRADAELPRRGRGRGRDARLAHAARRGAAGGAGARDRGGERRGDPAAARPDPRQRRRALRRAGGRRRRGARRRRTGARCISARAAISASPGARPSPT